MKIDEIPFAEFDATTFLHRYVKPGIPAVLRGFMDPDAVFSFESYVEHEGSRALIVGDDWCRSLPLRPMYPNVSRLGSARRTSTSRTSSAFRDWGTRFPRKRSTVPAPGDLLYLPTQWTHQVEGIAGDLVISFNQLWNARPWYRNLRTDRAAFDFLKRKLPQKAPLESYAWLREGCDEEPRP